MRRLLTTSIVLGLALGTFACLVSVDESLIDTKTDAAAPASDAGAEADAPLPYLGLPCGKGHCTRTGQVCCATTFGDPDIANGSCTTSSLCESGDWFACTSARDCREQGLGDVYCCAVLLKGAFNVTKCASTCASPDVVLCDAAAPRCPTGLQCLPSTRFPALHECAAPP